jgi:hypothetical protein
MSVYTDNGYASRKEYLMELSEEYACPIGTVLILANLLGPDEDFDGLVTSIQDWAQGMYKDL